jgi:exodeoxyribonuclease V gamma subunit
MDAIDKGFAIDGRPASERLQVRHRLQPFSPAYFKGDKNLFSYSGTRLEEARRFLEPRRDLPPFISGALAPPDDALKNISMAELVRFFSNPARFFLNRRFGIYLGEDEAPLEETESFELDRLSEYTLEQELIGAIGGGGDAAPLFDVMKASGRLPHGAPGERAFKEMRRGVEDFLRRSEPYISGKPLAPLDIDLRVGEFRITGRLEPIFPVHLVHLRYGRLRARDRLAAWISHLLLGLGRPPDYPDRSVAVGRESEKWKAVEYPPARRSEEALRVLVGHYWRGLSKPLHFFPEASLSYFRKIYRGGHPPGAVLEEVEAAWASNPFGPAEGDDPYYKLCFRSGAPFDSEFPQISEEVFRPLLDAEKNQ